MQKMIFQVRPIFPKFSQKYYSQGFVKLGPNLKFRSVWINDGVNNNQAKYHDNRLSNRNDFNYHDGT